MRAITFGGGGGGGVEGGKVSLDLGNKEGYREWRERKGGGKIYVCGGDRVVVSFRKCEMEKRIMIEK